MLNLKSYREAPLGNWYFDLLGSSNIEFKNFDTVFCDESCTMISNFNSLLPRIDSSYLGCHKIYFWVSWG